MPTYSDEWDKGDYRANNETRNRMGFGGEEFGGKEYAQRDRMLGSQAQDRGAYVSDMTQSNNARGYQTDALDMLHGAAAGTAPSQAAIQAQAAGDRSAATNMSLAGSVKGGAGARVAATRVAMANNAAMGAQTAQTAAAARANEMANARGQLMQGSSAMRGEDLNAAQIQQQNELTQRQLNDAQQRFYETQGYNTQVQDQNNQLAQQQLANNAWGEGRAATMADEGFGFNKNMTYAKAAAGGASGAIGGAAAAGGGGGGDDMGSDERMKDVYVPRDLTLSPIEVKNVVPYGQATADDGGGYQMSGGGLDVMGTLRANNAELNGYMRHPGAGTMLSPREAKVTASYPEAMQSFADGRGAPGVNYGYFDDRQGPVYGAYDNDAQQQVDATRAAGGYANLDMSPIPRQSSLDAAMQGAGDGADPYGARSKTDRNADRNAAGTAPSGGGSGFLGGLLGGLGGFANSGGRNTMTSDNEAKLLAAYESGKRAGAGEDRAEVAYGQEMAKAADRRDAAELADTREAMSEERLKKASKLTGPEKKMVEPSFREKLGAIASRVDAMTAPYSRPFISAAAGPFAPQAVDRLADSAHNQPPAPVVAPLPDTYDAGTRTTSDEQAKEVVDLDAGSDKSRMRDGPSDPRAHSFEATFRRDTPADQARVKRAYQDKAGRDADELLASFKSREAEGPSVKAEKDSYVPDMAMFAAMRSMKPQIYAYKSEFKPPEQQEGELQAGPMANNMARDPIAAMTLVRDPNTGLLAIDKDKALKLTMGSLATLADDVEELKRKKKGGQK
jgi:hypothetical protein